MYYVVVDIGCIECDEPTNVLGIFTNKQTAEEVKEKGNYYTNIFEVTELNKFIKGEE